MSATDNDFNDLLQDIDNLINDQGYCTIAVKTENDTEVKRAVALACSVKLADPNRPFSLITDSFDSVPKKYENVFDSIIELPYGHTDSTEDSLINFWQLYHCTPYEQTLFLDTKTLVLDTQIQNYWDNWCKSDLVLASSSKNIKGEQSNFKYRWKVHNANELPTYYTDLIFFSKNDQSQQFFKMLDPVLKNFRNVYLKYITENRPMYFDFNLLVNTTLKMLGDESNIFGDIPHTIISLDNLRLDDNDLPEDWIDYLGCWYTNGKIKVGNHRLHEIVCYNSYSFLDDEILDDYRQRYTDSQIRI